MLFKNKQTTPPTKLKNTHLDSVKKTDMDMYTNRRGKVVLLEEDHWTSVTPNQFLGAFAPFPRFAWIHPNAPRDSYDVVCEIVWSKATQVKPGRGQSSLEIQGSKDDTPSVNKSSHRAEKQQEDTDDYTHYEEDKKQYHTDFTLPCPYLLGRRHHGLSKPARVLSPVLEVEMRQIKEEAGGNRNSYFPLFLNSQSCRERDVQDKQRSVENSLQKMQVSQSSRAGTQSSVPAPQHLVTNPVCFEGHTQHLPDREDSLHPFKLPGDECGSEKEQNASRGSESYSSDDSDAVSLPGVRSCANDNSNNDSVVSAKEVKKKEIPSSSVELSCDNEQDSFFTADEDFPALTTINAGIPLSLTGPPALGKIKGQWEIPLSFHPHDIPTVTLASGVNDPVQASIQGKPEAPEANSKTKAPPAVPVQNEAYDLLADFPALQPPKNPLALGELRHRNPKTNVSKGKGVLTPAPSHCQSSRGSHERRLENSPHEVSSICAGDQKSALDLQTFGTVSHRNSSTISCEQRKANKQPPPRVAGADGVGVSARSWANAAKAGMKQAAAPQEKARPCTFQQIVTINKAKAEYGVTQKINKKATVFHPGSNQKAITLKQC
ncbi:uncharacterized protein LOC100709710 isoform X1 [Oreochromis niloticus]|uniref:uncharacterized protein LOC100709710 isoform X1 n=1 Tax=Oreochromis niloticus TaxID=8128 RepID=UPI0006742A8F|nr:uncharacterized protein LOC100709710 isoform X1 [Oreochromis niloticus]XP_025758096.1 uncharacterized protein LOC100709710 isoform X1 [Oreochromis niloticus]